METYSSSILLNGIEVTNQFEYNDVMNLITHQMLLAEINLSWIFT